ncbi:MULTISPECIES: WXG100 family type VII secretion target [unclassified Streptomyces]|uniref:WXG100 family type VII secretion target n=1 Tax=unclassified Streptomyces TaxID=2593676 RepID=UPI00224FEC56|nr:MULTISPECIES: WXG100 family type VII secretion target [unclassified Streptomyces]WSP55687.1 WXG100 family type VII secretion target [Streptomyces sp. NBC_01241]WSU23576.1 WXG100 family type VII secretion target [Streptomyces sp. NBC_01108]MCX4787385.1 WXG100 family type VII secretion target [Streptomyces sp. NBC_01221]MCX4796830.1 WXG100 family type VII secretion target [Streptomyces sp. NBC_01242]WSJ38045.1 WXG100 family type VII secretion target [Streptomyces sp. NBC_01321]
MEITYSGVVEASNQVKSTADTIKTQLDELNAKVKAVVATWDGETQQAFHDRHSGWDIRVNHMHETLTTISRKLMEATEGYRANDLAQARRFHG